MKILNNREWQLDFSEGKFRKLHFKIGGSQSNLN